MLLLNTAHKLTYYPWLACCLVWSSSTLAFNDQDTTQQTVEIMPADQSAEYIIEEQKNETYTFGFGTGISTLTGQFNLTFPVNASRSMVVRVQKNSLAYYGFKERLEEVDDALTEEVDATYNSAGIIFDWHPWIDAFALSIGIYKPEIGVSINEQLSTSSLVGDAVIEGSGTLSINMAIAKEYSPYIGIRFGNALAPGWPVSFYLDIGVLQLSTDIEIDANIYAQKIDNNGQLIDVTQEDIDKEIEIQREDFGIDEASIDEASLLMPVITFGLQISF